MCGKEGRRGKEGKRGRQDSPLIRQHRSSFLLRSTPPSLARLTPHPGLNLFLLPACIPVCLALSPTSSCTFLFFSFIASPFVFCYRARYCLTSINVLSWTTFLQNKKKKGFSSHPQLVLPSSSPPATTNLTTLDSHLTP